jgi:hypothetical protein
MNGAVRWCNYRIATFPLRFDQSLDRTVFVASLSKLLALSFSAAVKKMHAVGSVLEVTRFDSSDEIGESGIACPRLELFVRVALIEIEELEAAADRSAYVAKACSATLVSRANLLFSRTLCLVLSPADGIWTLRSVLPRRQNAYPRFICPDREF